MTIMYHYLFKVFNKKIAVSLQMPDVVNTIIGPEYVPEPCFIG